MVHNASEFQRLGMKVPILIGGATTSKTHTAVKIAPKYSSPVIHCGDASKSVVVCSALLDDKQRDDLVMDIEDEYEDIRDEHYESLNEKKYWSLNEARKRAPLFDFSAVQKPNFVGKRIFDDFPLEEIIPLIDWKPFFDMWQLRGKYPNKNFPNIFKDKDIGEEAQKVYNDAQNMLKDIVRKKLLKARAAVGIFACSSHQDDIVIYSEEGGAVGKIHGLRQQAVRDVNDKCFCLSDFVAKESSGVQDYIGMFVVSAGFGVEEACAKLEERLDDYGSIMLKALADRLAEGLAELLHLKVVTVTDKSWILISC